MACYMSTKGGGVGGGCAHSRAECKAEGNSKNEMPDLHLVGSYIPSIMTICETDP